jgi:Cu2+-containing amine oxidase
MRVLIFELRTAEVVGMVSADPEQSPAQAVHDSAIRHLHLQKWEINDQSIGPPLQTSQPIQINQPCERNADKGVGP